ncbi:hypothetical protein BST61_g10480 [Cercospora zeina]
MCAHEHPTRHDPDPQAQRSAWSQLQAMRESTHIAQDASTHAHPGPYYGSFLQSISDDITHYLAHQHTKKPPEDTTRCQPQDHASTRNTKRKSHQNASQPRPKHTKRRNDTPP